MGSGCRVTSDGGNFRVYNFSAEKETRIQYHINCLHYISVKALFYTFKKGGVIYKLLLILWSGI